MPNLQTSLSASWECEDAGTPFLDDTANNNDLTIDGVTLQQTGLFGYCGSYDAVNDKADIAHASQTGLDVATESFTIEYWTKSTLAAAGNRYAVAKWTGTGGNAGYALGVVGNPALAVGHVSDGVDQINVQGTTSLGAGTHQIVMVHNKTTNLLKLYVDGVEEDSQSIAAVGSLTNTLAFGLGRINVSSNLYGGLIDRVRFWLGRALSAGEVTTLYNGGAGRSYAGLVLSGTGGAMMSGLGS